MLGADIINESDHEVGVFYARGNDNISEHDISDTELKATSNYLGSYANTSVGSFFVDVNLGIGLTDNTSDRSTTFNNLSGDVKADFKTTSFFFNAIASLDIETQSGLTYSPFTSYSHINVNQDALDESGSAPILLSIEKSSSASNLIGLGLDTAYSFSQSFTAGIGLLFEHDLNSENHEINASFKGLAGTQETYFSQHRGEKIMTFNAKSTFHVSPTSRLEFGLDYSKFNNGNEAGGNLAFISSF